MVVHDRRNDVGRLTFPAGLVQFFVHPHVVLVVFGVGILAVLPVGAPARIRAFYNVYEALAFTGVVAIVVGRDEVAVFIKSKFVGVAQASGKNFKIAAIGIGAGNKARVGIGQFFSINGGDVGPNITNVPVNPAIRAFGNARHAVATKANVHRVSGCERSLFAYYTFIVFDFPKVGSNGYEDVFGGHQEATRYIGNFVVKVV